MKIESHGVALTSIRVVASIMFLIAIFYFSDAVLASFSLDNSFINAVMYAIIAFFYFWALEAVKR
jgi:type IV secretory pathway TraG/TraD family ATPase VirD4